jgi:SAM-dependent methyltransferase
VAPPKSPIMDYRFITREFQTLTGTAAEEQLAARNDASFLSADSGIVVVSRPRWELAQDAERHGWMNLWATAATDRNEHHFALFDYFMCLRQHPFKRAIELGCGPFTNMRIIAAFLEIARVELLDPLMQSYLGHEHCSYKTGRLTLANGQVQDVEKLHALPIEDFEPKPIYDVVILINVIEHCIDASKVFEQVWAMLEPGGLFIFHDKYFDHQKVSSRVLAEYDTAHPLKADRRFIDDFLGRFRMVFRRTINTEGAAAMTDLGDAVYFIGQRP